MEKELFIIDDDNIYRMIVSRMINRIDADLFITQCENGQIGLSILEQKSTNTNEVIVLLDINMPILNGWGFLEQVAKQNFFDIKLLKIYIVSSSTDKSDLLKAEKYDFVKGFLHKPLSKEDISSIVN
jgi:CheY-like chemotaxis protein